MMMLGSSLKALVLSC
jgi:hypothetical protein